MPSVFCRALYQNLQPGLAYPLVIIPSLGCCVSFFLVGYHCYCEGLTFPEFIKKESKIQSRVHTVAKDIPREPTLFSKRDPRADGVRPANSLLYFTLAMVGGGSRVEEGAAAGNAAGTTGAANNHSKGARGPPREPLIDQERPLGSYILHQSTRSTNPPDPPIHLMSY